MYVYIYTFEPVWTFFSVCYGFQPYWPFFLDKPVFARNDHYCDYMLEKIWQALVYTWWVGRDNDDVDDADDDTDDTVYLSN